jgi:adenosyl cobinamide kinase/adenosyl cobinamide phosphate guanylyltransferase
VIALFLGGARSGKSALAERFAATLPGPVTYVATFSSNGADPEMEARIAAHRARRPADWETCEAGADLPGVVRRVGGTLLIDSLGMWVAGGHADADSLCDALVGRVGDCVIVSEEVGLGVHPSSAAGRTFRDALGALNQRVAAIADAASLVVAGRALRLERL